jgi:hypothetical protein
LVSKISISGRSTSGGEMANMLPTTRIGSFGVAGGVASTLDATKAVTSRGTILLTSRAVVNSFMYT